MARYRTDHGSGHTTTFWESIETVLHGFSVFFGNRSRAESGLESLQREQDRIRLKSRHWLL